MINQSACAREPEDWWDAAPDAVELNAGEVHVWRVPLRLSDALLAWADSLLDRAERARASRFHFARDRARFVAGRAIQRELLARYLEVSPEEVQYRANQFGKLEVTSAGVETDLQFNFSNSADLGLLAVATGRAVGIDIEKLRPVPDARRLASGWFSAAERAVLRSAHAVERDAMFLRCWTHKEAYIKAVGEGLSLPLDSFDVSFAPGEESRLLDHRVSPSETARWTMQALAPAAGYVGALVVEGHGWTRRQYEWVS